MLPLLKKLRPAVKCHIAAQPVPYKTTDSCPTFTSLKDEQGKQYFPLRLDTQLVSRFEMADFAKEAAEVGINYIGVCCGCAPVQIREMAEALGRKVPSSRFTADMSLHGMLGDDKINKHQKKFKNQWQ
jgi:betaine-homocysteine S-methyltransferase